MTAEDIYRHLLDSGDEIGLATVYRVLTQFEAAGLVLKHNFEGGTAVYEIDRGGHHDHMVDVDTGRIIEFESAEIEKQQKEVAEKNGYQPDEHSLVLYVRNKRSVGATPPTLRHPFRVSGDSGSFVPIAGIRSEKP